MQKMTLIFTVIYIVSICLPGSSEGDQRKSTSDIIKKCRECRLFLKNEEDIQGKLIYLGNNYLKIESTETLPKQPFQIRSHQQTIPFDDVLLLQCGDPTYDGAIKGLIIGGLSAALVVGLLTSMNREPQYEYETSVGELIAWGFLIGGGFGSAIGFLTDIENGFSIETKEINEWLGEDKR
jgi:hypothetical protein